MTFSAVTERGSANTKTSGTTLAVSPTANLTVGKIVFIECATDNTPTTSGASTEHTSVTDTQGHAWTKVYERTRTAGAVADGVTKSKWWTKITTQIGTGDSITLTIATARDARVIGLWEVTVGAGMTIQIATGTTPTVFTEASIQNPAAQTTSGLSNIEHLHVGAVGKEDVTLTWTEDAGYTNVYAAEGIQTSGGAALSNITINVGTIISTSTGDTFDPGNIAAGARDIAMTLVAFEELSLGITLPSISGTQVFAPQVKGQVSLGLISSTQVFAPQINGRVVLGLINSTVVFEPVRVAGINVGLGLISSTQVFAPQINGQIQLVLISSTQVFDPVVIALVGLPLISSTQVFAPVLNGQIVLALIATTQLFAPQVNGRVTFALISSTQLFAPRIFLSVTRVPASVVSNVGWDTGPTPGGDIDAALAARGGDYITVTA